MMNTKRTPRISTAKAKKISYPDTRVTGKPMDSNTILLAGKISSNMMKDINQYCKENNMSASEFIRLAASTFLHEQA